MKIVIYMVVIVAMVLALSYSTVFARGHKLFPLQMPQAETVWVDTNSL